MTGAPITVLPSSDVFANSVVGTVVALQMDTAGNFFVANGNVVAKLDPQLNQVWRTTLLGPQASMFVVGETNLGARSTALRVDSAGNVFVGGRVTIGNVTSAAVTQLAPNGAQMWTQTTGPTVGSTQIRSVALGAEGSVYAAGDSTGQLPNQPAAASGHGFVLHYGPDGTPLSAFQLPNLNVSTSQISVGPTGESFLLNQQLVSAVSADGSLAWNMSPTIQVLNVVATPDGTAVFDVERQGGIPFLVRRDPATGAVVWQRGFAKPTAVINTVEGQTWTGSFDPDMEFVASNEGLYMTGFYTNMYSNGSAPIPSSDPNYVAKLDLMGNQIWFRQFEFSPATGSAPQPVDSTAIALGGPNQGKVAIVGLTRILFSLNAIDGTGP